MQRLNIYYVYVRAHAAAEAEQVLHRLKRLALIHNLAVVITNQA